MSEDKSMSYLEGNYNGISTGKGSTKRESGRNKYIKSVEEMKEEAEKSAKEQISELYNVTGEELDSLYAEYGIDDRFGEFLIDGAVLRCNQATPNDFEIPNVGTVVLEKVAGKDSEECCQMILHVPENPISDNNGKCYATVKDTVFNKNIIPPKCNCNLMTDRQEEIEKIMADPDRSKNGVCRHLMKLNEKWDNMIIEGRNYMTQTNVKSTMLSAGIEDVFGARSSFGNSEREEAECITMTSMLFCKHGGLITPVTSGQEISLMDVDSALNKMTQYLRGEGVSEEELNITIDWLAAHCGLKVNDMIKGQFSEEVDSEAHKRSQKFDNQIIAWTYYWNVKIQNEFSYQFTIDPNIVKAIIAQESSFGLIIEEKKAKNPSRNVMQSLATGNSTVWVASGINPYADNMFKVGDSIAYKMLDGTIETDGDLARGHLTIYTEEDFNEERKKCHFTDFDILKNIFEIGDDGRYMVVFDNVTTNMSIATGIGLLASKIESAQNIYTGVVGYNTDENYAEIINGHLSDMGCLKLVE